MWESAAREISVDNASTGVRFYLFYRTNKKKKISAGAIPVVTTKQPTMASLRVMLLLQWGLWLTLNIHTKCKTNTVIAKLIQKSVLIWLCTTSANGGLVPETLFSTNHIYLS